MNTESPVVKRELGDFEATLYKQERDDFYPTPAKQEVYNLINVHIKDEIEVGFTSCTQTEYYNIADLGEQYLTKNITVNNKTNESRSPSKLRFYKCNICEKTFNDPSNCNRHKKIHYDEGTSVCKICNKILKSATAYKHHMSVHMGNGPHECNICYKRFYRSCDHEIHMKFHFDIRDYACKVCNKTFVTSSILRRHLLQVHVGAKPYKCEVCPSKFARASDLKTHMKLHVDYKLQKKTNRNVTKIKI